MLPHPLSLYIPSGSVSGSVKSEGMVVKGSILRQGGGGGGGDITGAAAASATFEFTQSMSDTGKFNKVNTCSATIKLVSESESESASGREVGLASESGGVGGGMTMVMEGGTYTSGALMMARRGSGTFRARKQQRT